MNEDLLKYNLISGIDIPYQNIFIKQPKMKDIDRIGLLLYLSMTYIFRIQKAHLSMYDEIKNELNDKSLFESLIINEIELTNKEEFNIQDSMIMLLISSLAFFLRIEDLNRIKVKNDYKIVVYDSKEDNGETDKIPIFTLDNSNFDEFCELIRIITVSNIIEFEKEDKVKIRKYKDNSMQKRYEELMGQLKDNKEKKKNENSITIADIKGAICTNRYTKYNYESIKELTIWQLFYEFNNMFTMENIDMIKSQYNSGNFQFKSPPDINWLNKVKIKLPIDNKKQNKMSD